MRYVCAYCLAVLGGKANPTAGDLEKILSSVGIESDGQRIKLIMEQMKAKGKNVDELIAEGSKMLASMPMGGGGAAAPAAVAAAAPAAAEEKKESKKEEKKQESDSEDDDMGFGLFD